MFLKTHNAAEAVKLCEAGVRFCDKIRTFNIAQVFASFLFKLFYIQWLYFLALSLVFICRENSRRSGILLFPNRPRFCRLMKTRNRRYRRSSGGQIWRIGSVSIYPTRPRFLRWSAIIPDKGKLKFVPLGGRRRPSASVGDGFRSLPIP